MATHLRFLYGANCYIKTNLCVSVGYVLGAWDIAHFFFLLCSFLLCWIWSLSWRSFSLPLFNIFLQRPLQFCNNKCKWAVLNSHRSVFYSIPFKKYYNHAQINVMLSQKECSFLCFWRKGLRNLFWYLQLIDFSCPRICCKICSAVGAHGLELIWRNCSYTSRVAPPLESMMNLE